MTATNEADRSPAPGIIPDPVYVHDDPGPATAATKQRGGRKPGRRNPVRVAAATVMGALHGDKYMVDAYPAAGQAGAVPPDSASSLARER
jgi:hypothetical protein